MFFSVISSAGVVVTVTVSGSVVSVTPVAVGTSVITVTADDGLEGTVSDAFTVSVKAAVVQVAPVVVTVISNQTLREDASPFPRDLTASPEVFTDGNGDVLTFAASSSDALIATASISGNILTVTPIKDGIATITVHAAALGGMLG